MNLIIGKGLDSLKFGITEEEVRSLLGAADKTYLTDSGCKRVQYNDTQIELSFEPENDNRLGWVEVHNPDVFLLGDQVIGKNEEIVVEFLNSELGTEPKVEDYGSFVSVNYEAEWLELQFEFGRLKNINLGVLYGDDDAPAWPRT